MTLPLPGAGPAATDAGSPASAATTTTTTASTATTHPPGGYPPSAGRRMSANGHLGPVWEEPAMHAAPPTATGKTLLSTGRPPSGRNSAYPSNLSSSARVYSGGRRSSLSGGSGSASRSSLYHNHNHNHLQQQQQQQAVAAAAYAYQQQQFLQQYYAAAHADQQATANANAFRGRTHSLPSIHQPHLVTSSSSMTHPHAAAGSRPRSGSGSTETCMYSMDGVNFEGSTPSMQPPMAGAIVDTATPSTQQLSSYPAPTLPAITDVVYQDDYHWERLALNSASSLPAPVPNSVSFQPMHHFPPNVHFYHHQQQHPLHDSQAQQQFYGSSQPSSLSNTPYASAHPLVAPHSYTSASSFAAYSHPHSVLPPHGYQQPIAHRAPFPPVQSVVHASLFTTANPQSDMLVDFISKMVFVIFWHGSEAFDQCLRSVKLRSLSALRDMPMEMLQLPHAHAYEPTVEFVKYTKYLLQTMQLSCSTALLSLLYLHRLRPRVQHMFVPGTFGSNNASNTQHAADGKSASTQQRYQYRRDPKLEYRLFTISVILSNKYLDDNSYSNKAWSDVTGLELRKINIMEQEFMKYVDYSLVVDKFEYATWVHWLDGHVSEIMGTPSKLFSFEPLVPLLPSSVTDMMAHSPRRHSSGNGSGLTINTSLAARRSSIPVTPTYVTAQPQSAPVYGDVRKKQSRFFLPTPKSGRRASDAGRYSIPRPQAHPPPQQTVSQESGSFSFLPAAVVHQDSSCQNHLNSDACSTTSSVGSACATTVTACSQQSSCTSLAGTPSGDGNGWKRPADSDGFQTCCSSTDESPVVLSQRIRTRSSTSIPIPRGSGMRTIELPEAYSRMHLENPTSNRRSSRSSTESARRLSVVSNASGHGSGTGGVSAASLYPPPSHS